MSSRCHIVSPVDRDDGGIMNAEDLVIAFKRDMAKLSGTERRRAIESVRDVIRAAAFDDAAGSAYEVERCHVCLKTAYTMRHRLIECLSAYSPSFKTGRGCGGELDEIYFPESFKDKGNRAKGLFAMPSNIPATTIRIDPEAKKEATAILDELGLPMSTAVNAFLGALVREGGMLFEMKVKAPAIDLER